MLQQDSLPLLSESPGHTVEREIQIHPPVSHHLLSLVTAPSPPINNSKEGKEMA